MDDHSSQTCSACGSKAEFLGQIPLRTKGTGGVAKLFFGEWAELGEEKMPLDTFRCTQCGHIDFYDLDFSM